MISIIIPFDKDHFNKMIIVNIDIDSDTVLLMIYQFINYDQNIYNFVMITILCRVLQSSKFLAKAKSVFYSRYPTVPLVLKNWKKN